MIFTTLAGIGLFVEVTSTPLLRMSCKRKLGSKGASSFASDRQSISFTCLLPSLMTIDSFVFCCRFLQIPWCSFNSSLSNHARHFVQTTLRLHLLLILVGGDRRRLRSSCWTFQASQFLLVVFGIVLYVARHSRA